MTIEEIISEIDELMKGRKPAQIGDRRKMAGRVLEKTPSGWRTVGKSGYPSGYNPNKKNKDKEAAKPTTSSTVVSGSGRGEGEGEGEGAETDNNEPITSLPAIESIEGDYAPKEFTNRAGATLKMYHYQTEKGDRYMFTFFKKDSTIPFDSPINAADTKSAFKVIKRFFE